MLSKFSRLYSKSGLLLFLWRMPFRVMNSGLNSCNSFLWRLSLGGCGKCVVIERGVKIENPRQVVLGDRVYIGTGTIIGAESNDGQLLVGGGVHIGRRCRIDHTGDVNLGEDVLFSEDVSVFSHSHGHAPKGKALPTPLTIGERTWLGYRSVILEGVGEIASDSLVAAGAVVANRCAEPGAVYGGVPAKLIKKK